MALNREVLVWGATPTDSDPLFRAGVINGPPAGQFRIEVRNALRRRLATYGLDVAFSEDGNKYGHHEENPGLYEPRQLCDAKMVLLLFPSKRAMAVNTWELALACETSGSAQEPVHKQKLAFVIPRSLFDYLVTAMKEGVTDPAQFIWPLTNPEPVLGAQNSFAVRWIYLLAPKRFAAAGSIGDPCDVVPITYYDDTRPWGIGDADCTSLIGKICNFVVAHLPP